MQCGLGAPPGGDGESMTLDRALDVPERWKIARRGSSQLRRLFTLGDQASKPQETSRRRICSNSAFRCRIRLLRPAGKVVFGAPGRNRRNFEVFECAPHE